MGCILRRELEKMGFAGLGENVCISEKASIYNPAAISLGNHVRIDDFCVLSAGKGGICLGNYVHIAIYSALVGVEKITMEDFSSLSSRVCIYSSTDDYSGAGLTNPTVPEVYKNTHTAPVYIGRHVIIGSGSIVLPGVEISEGCAIGALSMVKRDCAPFGLYAGVPAKRLKERKKDLLALEQELKDKI